MNAEFIEIQSEKERFEVISDLCNNILELDSFKAACLTGRAKLVFNEIIGRCSTDEYNQRYRTINKVDNILQVISMYHKQTDVMQGLRFSHIVLDASCYFGELLNCCKTRLRLEPMILFIVGTKEEIGAICKTY